ncbi:MAG: nuclear transport factor 2 family protein, partial [Flavobacteriales bacterium]
PVSVHSINEHEVAAFGNLNVTMNATGKKVSSDWAMHWEFNDEGQIVYFKNFFDTAALYLANQKLKAATTEQEEKNISIVRNAFDNFLKGDIEGILNECTDDIEWGAHDNPEVPYAKTYHGKEGARDFFSTLSANIEYLAFKPKEFYADGDKVFVKGYHRARVKSNGNSFAHSYLMEFTLNDGKTSSFFAWVDTRDQSQAFNS